MTTALWVVGALFVWVSGSFLFGYLAPRMAKRFVSPKKMSPKMMILSRPGGRTRHTLEGMSDLPPGRYICDVFEIEPVGSLRGSEVHLRAEPPDLKAVD